MHPQTQWDALVKVVDVKVKEGKDMLEPLGPTPDAAALEERNQHLEKLDRLLQDVQTEASSYSRVISEPLWRRLLEGLGVDACRLVQFRPRAAVSVNFDSANQPMFFPSPRRAKHEGCAVYVRCNRDAHVFGA